MIHTLLLLVTMASAGAPPNIAVLPARIHSVGSIAPSGDISAHSRYIIKEIINRATERGCEVRSPDLGAVKKEQLDAAYGSVRSAATIGDVVGADYLIIPRLSVDCDGMWPVNIATKIELEMEVVRVKGGTLVGPILTANDRCRDNAWSGRRMTEMLEVCLLGRSIGKETKARDGKGLLDLLPWQEMSTVKPTADWIKGKTCIVFVPETIVRRNPPDPAAETEIIKGLRAAGLKVMDQQTLRQLREDAEVQAALKGNLTRAKSVALQAKYRAEILVVGEAFAEVLQENGRQLARARVEVKMIHLPTAVILAADGVQTSAQDITGDAAAKQALQNGGNQMVPLLLPQVPGVAPNSSESEPSGSGEKPAPGIRKMSVTVTGLKGASESKKFADAIRALKGISKVIDPSFEDDRMVLDVEADIGEVDIADLIENSSQIKRLLGTRKIKTVRARDGIIEIALTK